MWHRPYQSATILYFLSRYLPFVVLIYDLAMVQGATSEVDEVLLFIMDSSPAFLINGPRILVGFHT